MRAMDLVQWQSTFRYMEDQGFNIQYHRRKGKEGGGARGEARDEPRTQKSKSAASKQNKFGETVTGKFMHHTETLVLFL